MAESAHAVLAGSGMRLALLGRGYDASRRQRPLSLSGRPQMSDVISSSGVLGAMPCQALIRSLRCSRLESTVHRAVRLRDVPTGCDSAMWKGNAALWRSKAMGGAKRWRNGAAAGATTISGSSKPYDVPRSNGRDKLSGNAGPLRQPASGRSNNGRPHIRSSRPSRRGFAQSGSSTRSSNSGSCSVTRWSAIRRRPLSAGGGLTHRSRWTSVPGLVRSLHRAGRSSYHRNQVVWLLSWVLAGSAMRLRLPRRVCGSGRHRIATGGRKRSGWLCWSASVPSTARPKRRPLMRWRPSTGSWMKSARHTGQGSPQQSRLI